MEQRTSSNGTLIAAVVIAACSLVTGCHGNRDEWQKPDEVLNRLAIEPGAAVADLGAGDGYFALKLAKAVGADGRVYAIDIDDAVLAELEAEATAQGLTQLVIVVGSRTSSGLAPESVDLVLVCNTFHHISDRVAYFARLRGVLRTGGRVAIIELDDVPWYLGPMLSDHMTASAAVVAEMKAAGYELVTAYDVLDHQNFQVFTPIEP